MLNGSYIHLHQPLGLGSLWLNQQARIRPPEGSLKTEGFNEVKTSNASFNKIKTEGLNEVKTSNTHSGESEAKTEPRYPTQTPTNPAAQGNALAKIRQRSAPSHTPSAPQPAAAPRIKRLPLRGRHGSRQIVQRRRRRNAAQHAQRHRPPARASPFQHMAQKQPRFQPPPRRANHHRRRPRHRPRMAANPSPSHAPAGRLFPPPRSASRAQRHRPSRRALPHPPPHAPGRQSPAQTQRVGNPAKTPSRAKMI